MPKFGYTLRFDTCNFYFGYPLTLTLTTTPLDISQPDPNPNDDQVTIVETAKLDRKRKYVSYYIAFEFQLHFEGEGGWGIHNTYNRTNPNLFLNMHDHTRIICVTTFLRLSMSHDALSLFLSWFQTGVYIFPYIFFATPPPLNPTRGGLLRAYQVWGGAY